MRASSAEMRMISFLQNKTRLSSRYLSNVLIRFMIKLAPPGTLGRCGVSVELRSENLRPRSLARQPEITITAFSLLEVICRNVSAEANVTPAFL